jgi:hypothetical protein
LVNAAPDANGYAVMNYVRADLITFTKFLTSRSEAYGSFNTYYLHSDNTWEVSKEVKLNKVEANVDGEVNGELTSIRIGKEVYSIPSTEGFATTSYVDDAVKNITVDTTNFATLAQLAEKADEIPFKEAKIVSNPIGSFAIGDSVEGLTVAEIFAKLLGFSIDNPNPDEPEIPGITGDIVESIITNQLPVYQANELGEIQEVAYTYNTYADAGAISEDTGFYQVKDNGTVVESGYEHVTYPQDMCYMIALPNSMILGENTRVQVWDDINSIWVNDTTEFTNDYDEIVTTLAEAFGSAAPVVPDGYTLWADLSDINSGKIYRFIINEGV